MNIKTVKRYMVTFFFPMFVGAGTFISGVFFKELWMIGAVFGGLVIFFGLFGLLMLSNPFQKLQEGKGIATLTMDSTGILRVILSRLNMPFVAGKFNKTEYEFMHDRANMYHMQNPIDAKNPAFIDDKQNLHIVLTKEEYNSSRFQINSYPTIIYNGMTNSILTKQMLADLEVAMWTEHQLLLVNQKTDKLNEWLVHMARHVVDQLVKKKGITTKMLIWIFIILGVVILAILYGPQIMQMFGIGGKAAAGGAAANSGQAVQVG
jgi:hypothetical protein